MAKQETLPKGVGGGIMGKMLKYNIFAIFLYGKYKK